MDLDAALADAERATAYLHRGLVELRPQTAPKTYMSGYYSDPAKLAYDATGAVALAVYWTINEIGGRGATHELRPAVTGACTGKPHIVRLRNLFIDLDPIRPKGTASTDTAHQAAIDLAQRIRADLTAAGWPEPMVQDSGNGAYLFWAVDLAPAQATLVKAVIDYLHRTYTTATINVDKSSANVAKIVRVPGTENRKGEPYRYARVLYMPEQRVEVTEAQLEALVWSALPQSSCEPVIDYAVTTGREKAYLDSHDVNYAVEDHGEYTILRMTPCPWRPDQDDGNAWLRIHPAQGVSAGCFHGKCASKNLKALRSKLGDVDQVTTAAGQAEVDDPHYLARLHIDRFAHGGQRTSVVMAGQLTIWQDGVWRPAIDREVADNVVTTIKTEFDSAAKRNGKGAPRKVKSGIVRDTIAAIRSLSLMPYHIPPFWVGEPQMTLDGKYLNASDMLLFNNCLLHLPSWLAGGNYYWTPPTPRYYSEHKLNFHFWQEAPQPARWMQFLSELWDDPACHDLTHEWIGYCMTRYTHFQKLMMLIGEPRGGKGTIAWVMEQMVGGNVASPDFPSLLGPHGKAPFLGRQLALLPDAKMLSPKILDQVCTVLKQITGEDLVTVNPKNLPQVTLRLPVKITIQSNDLLAIPDTSEALQARQLFLRFDKSFVGREDLKLKEKLLPELPGIANLALAGLRRLMERGKFTEPEASRALATRIKHIGNPILAYVEARCTIDASKATPTTTMYDDYSRWAEDADIESMSRNKFGEQLTATYRTVAKTQNVGARKVAGKAKRPYCYVGIGLRD